MSSSCAREGEDHSEAEKGWDHPEAEKEQGHPEEEKGWDHQLVGMLVAGEEMDQKRME